MFFGTPYASPANSALKTTFLQMKPVLKAEVTQLIKTRMLVYCTQFWTQALNCRADLFNGLIPPVNTDFPILSPCFQCKSGIHFKLSDVHETHDTSCAGCAGDLELNFSLF